MTFEQPLVQPLSNRFIFSGKERQTDLGLNWDDFGARMYDPALGRFHTQDRFAEKYYAYNSYHYTLNNPINAIDINGDSTILIGWNKWTSNFNSNFRNTVASRASNPSLLLKTMRVMLIGGMAQTVADATFLSNAMGRKNQTANALEAGFNTLLDVPNMSKEQIGMLAAATTVVLMKVLAERRLPKLSGGDWRFSPSRDIDLRGTNATYKDAIDEAFTRTGVPRDQFSVTRWGQNSYGKSVPVEWQGPGGANVNMDIPQWNNVKPDGSLGAGPHQPHIGYQTPGKGKIEFVGISLSMTFLQRDTRLML